MLATPISRAYNAVVRGSATAAFVKGCLCNTGLGLPYHSDSSQTLARCKQVLHTNGLPGTLKPNTRS